MIKNRLDDLLDALNTIDGIEFVRDAWINDAPENYGVLELAGQNGGQWADGHLVDQSFALVITIYVKDGTDIWVDAVQGVLAAQDLAYGMPRREYDYGGDAVMWQWTATWYGPLTVELPDPEPEPEETEETEETEEEEGYGEDDG